MQPRILVVDDHAAMRLAMAAICKANGFRVRSASSAQEAMAALGAAACDVVLVDLKMETDTAGFKVAEFAARQTPRPIVIVVSAYPELGMEWRARGVDAFLEKPTEASVVLRSIEELLARRGRGDAA